MLSVNFVNVFRAAILQIMFVQPLLSTSLAGSLKRTTLAFEDSKFSSLFSPLGSRFLFSTSTTRKYGSNNFSYIHEALTILTWKTCAFLNSVQKFIEIQGWLLLTFFICLHNQLSSFNSIIVQMSEKRDSSNRQ